MALVYQIFYTDVSKVPHAVEACWAYNTEVRRSKPRSTITFCCCPFFVAVFRSIQLCEDKIYEASTAERQVSRLNMYRFKTLTTWIPRYSFLFLLVLFLMLVTGAFLKNPVQISGPKKLFKIKIYKNGAVFFHQTCPNCCFITYKLFPLLLKLTKLESLIKILKKRPGLLSAL